MDALVELMFVCMPPKHVCPVLPPGRIQVPQHLDLRPPHPGPLHPHLSPPPLQQPEPLRLESPQHPLLAGQQQHSPQKQLL